MWGFLADALFDFLPWQVQLALLGSFIVIVAVVVGLLWFNGAW